MANESMKKAEIIYPDLSYKIVGAAFAVSNEEGYGRREHYYRKALASELRNMRLKCVEEKMIRIRYRDGSFGTYFMDVLVEDKIVVEIKTTYRMQYVDIKQVVDYLR